MYYNYPSTNKFYNNYSRTNTFLLQLLKSYHSQHILITIITIIHQPTHSYYNHYNYIKLTHFYRKSYNYPKTNTFLLQLFHNQGLLITIIKKPTLFLFQFPHNQYSHNLYILTRDSLPKKSVSRNFYGMERTNRF